MFVRYENLLYEHFQMYDSITPFYVLISKKIFFLFDSTQSNSGVASRLQRWSEQLVLVAKAISILESALRQYQIEQATADIGTLEETTSLHTKKGIQDKFLCSKVELIIEWKLLFSGGRSAEVAGDVCG